MEIQEFVNHFANQFEETDLTEFNEDTHFRDLEEWNSFLALSIMAMIKSEYDVAVTASEMREAQSIRQLFDIVKKHMQ
ncbi:MAG: acyl carrier protein [Bacteroidales bacterium]|nr:acyl carrier protein [Bacteroidales bacterium]